MTPASGIILAGLHSSSGKTAVTCLILAALAERGWNVQPFKAGPDFIDPGYHHLYAKGMVSRNLDLWLMGSDAVQAEVAAHTQNRVGVLEGVMGLFDGSNPGSDEGSTMELARLLDWPIILVLPSGKAGRSMTATLRGFLAEAGPNRIVGVILNQVSGKSHADYLREALAPLKVPILGALPTCEECRWPERHLGLQASQERALPSRQALAQLAEKHLDLDQVAGLFQPIAPDHPLSPPLPAPRRRVGIARDQAFHFYYEANLDHLRQAGVELVPFSPLTDAALPTQLDGIILGGGFPEVFAEQLAQNSSLRHELRSSLTAGLPCYAECGGLMYLAQQLITREGQSFPMVGVLPGAVEMTGRLQHFGYCLASPKNGKSFHGHEFHHSIWHEEEHQANLWNVQRKRAGLKRQEGYRLPHLHASYVHLHFASSEAVVSSLFQLQPQRELVPL